MSLSMAAGRRRPRMAASWRRSKGGSLGRLHRGPASARAGAAWLAEMIRYRALLIAAGYPDGNNCDTLKADPAFKMAIRRTSYKEATSASQWPSSAPQDAQRGNDPPVPD
jgi:hypothetical protein